MKVKISKIFLFKVYVKHALVNLLLGLVSSAITVLIVIILKKLGLDTAMNIIAITIVTTVNAVLGTCKYNYRYKVTNAEPVILELMYIPALCILVTFMLFMYVRVIALSGNIHALIICYMLLPLINNGVIFHIRSIPYLYRLRKGK